MEAAAKRAGASSTRCARGRRRSATRWNSVSPILRRARPRVVAAAAAVGRRARGGARRAREEAEYERQRAEVEAQRQRLEDEAAAARFAAQQQERDLAQKQAQLDAEAAAQKQRASRREAEAARREARSARREEAEAARRDADNERRAADERAARGGVGGAAARGRGGGEQAGRREPPRGGGGAARGRRAPETGGRGGAPQRRRAPRGERRRAAAEAAAARRRRAAAARARAAAAARAAGPAPPAERFEEMRSAPAGTHAEDELLDAAMARCSTAGGRTTIGRTPTCSGGCERNLDAFTHHSSQRGLCPRVSGRTATRRRASPSPSAAAGPGRRRWSRWGGLHLVRRAEVARLLVVLRRLLLRRGVAAALRTLVRICEAMSGLYAFFCSVHSLWRVRHISMSIALEPATSSSRGPRAGRDRRVRGVCVYHGLPPVTR